MSSLISIEKRHIRECSELYLRVFNASPWNDQWTVDTAYKRLGDIYHAPNFEGIAYLEDGRVIGAIFGNCEQFYDGVHYNLREMFIADGSQGQGIGSKMLHHFEAHLKKQGITAIILFTSKENRTSSFYLKNEFKQWDGMTMMGKDI